ncbi:MAG: hypothetical protein ACKVQB_09230 [Bacteroidia bacterium]
MSKKVKIIALFFILLFGSKASNAQDGVSASHSILLTIPHVAMVDVEGGGSVSLGLSAPNEAGLGMSTSATNSSLWLNYSSTTNPSSSNSVMVKIDAALPGLDLKITASSDASAGDGATGTPASTLTLTTSEQSLINNIGSCYTGDGTNKGHNITYNLVANSYNLIEHSSTPGVTTITFTITNN